MSNLKQYKKQKLFINPVFNPIFTELIPPHYISEESNFRYVRLCDLDIPREKWLNVETPATEQNINTRLLNVSNNIIHNSR